MLTHETLYGMAYAHNDNRLCRRHDLSPTCQVQLTLLGGLGNTSQKEGSTPKL